MPIVAKQITNATTTCTVTVHVENANHEPVEEEVRVGYHRARITKALGRRMMALQDMEADEEVNAALDSMVLDLVGWWDVLQEEGKTTTIPLTPEGIAPLDYPFKMELMMGIVDHAGTYVPGEAPGEKQSLTRSNGFSPPKVRKTASRKR